MNIDSKILRYVEGKLEGKVKEDFENLLNSDSDLKLKVDILSNLYNNSIPENPPYELKNKIYDMLNIRNESIMDIVIEKTSNIFNVLSGEDSLVNIEPVFITRSNNHSLLFSKEMNNYKVFCEFFEDNGNNVMNLKALDMQNKKLSNIKFTLKQSSNIILEKYTNSNGYTDNFEIKNGDYIIDINKNNLDIGNIKINIS